MTLARLLEAHGELRRAGFDCTTCQQDEQLRASRGCGKAPAPEPDREPWIVARLVERVADGEVAREEAVNEAHLRYTWSNVGDVWGTLGTFWEWCPAWYARFYDGPCLPVADASIEVAAQVRRGFAPFISHAGLSGEVMRGALQAHVMMDAISHQQQKRELDERTKGAKPRR